MIDNCSTTARLGARRWAPRFDYTITQQAYVEIDEGKPADPKLFPAFKASVIHGVLGACSRLRPTVDIFVE